MKLTSIARKIFSKAGFDIVPYPAVPMDVRRMKVLRYLSFLFEKIAGVSGSVVECGVGKGRSFLVLSFLISQEGKGRRIWGFDSFEGFPEPSKNDSSDRNPKKGEWSGTHPDDIRSILKNAGISGDFARENVQLVPGFFEQTIERYDGSPIAFLHVDADLYDSYQVVLNHLFPLVAPGGVVLFDEYNETRWPGAKKAVDEFLQKHPHELHKVPFAEKYYIIKK